MCKTVNYTNTPYFISFILHIHSGITVTLKWCQRFIYGSVLTNIIIIPIANVELYKMSLLGTILWSNILSFYHQMKCCQKESELHQRHHWWGKYNSFSILGNEMISKCLQDIRGKCPGLSQLFIFSISGSSIIFSLWRNPLVRIFHSI